MAAPGAGDGSESLRQQFEHRKAAIRAMNDLAEAVREAGKLGDEMAVFRQEAAELRSELAARLRASRHLSIQGLADVIGVAKRTAQQILNYGKPRR